MLALVRPKIRTHDASAASKLPSIRPGFTQFILVYCLIPNILLIAITRTLPDHSGLFGLGYIIAGLITIGFSAMVGTFLLTLVFLLDLLSFLADTYYFTWTDIALSLRSLAYVPLPRLLLYGSEIVLLTSILGLTARKLSRTPVEHLERRRTFFACALFMLIVVGADFTVANAPTNDEFSASKLEVLRAPSVELPYRLFKLWRVYHHHFDEHAVDSATYATVATLHRKHAQPMIAQILVESLGSPFQRPILDEIEAPYRSPEIQARYDTRTGVVPFAGGTIDGEIRELCRTSLGLGVTKASASSLQHCLPTELKRAGYQTEAYHGYNSRMFDRYSWYPNIGFDRSLFADDFAAQHLPACTGAFTGTCDADIANWIGDRLVQAKKPTFLHWVTLNSHLPLPDHLDPQTYSAECAKVALADGSATCSWFKLQVRVQESIAQMASRPDLPDTVFIIVGDHAPPFMNQKFRGMFSQDVVPYLILTPKDLHLDSPVAAPNQTLRSTARELKNCESRATTSGHGHTISGCPALPRS